MSDQLFGSAREHPMPAGRQEAYSMKHSAPDTLLRMRYNSLDSPIQSYVDNIDQQIVELVRKYNFKDLLDFRDHMLDEKVSHEDVKRFTLLMGRLSSAMTENKIPREDKEAWQQYEARKPFVYDKQKAKEYGFSELMIEGHEKAQVLMDAIYSHDPAFVIIDEGYPTAKIDNIKFYWQEHCRDLPDISLNSTLFFDAIAQHYLSNTIDHDDDENITSPTKPHIPEFGKQEFLLVMDWKEFNWNDTTEKKSSITRQTKTLMQKLFRTKDVTSISRNTINEKLWTDHENRIHTPNALAVIQELIGQNKDPNQYELRLMRFDEYVRAAQIQDYGKKNLRIWFEGYYLNDDGHRGGLTGGGSVLGDVVRVEDSHRGVQSQQLAVRLVLSRRF